MNQRIDEMRKELKRIDAIDDETFTGQKQEARQQIVARTMLLAVDDVISEAGGNVAEEVQLTLELIKNLTQRLLSIERLAAFSRDVNRAKNGGEGGI